MTVRPRRMIAVVLMALVLALAMVLPVAEGRPARPPRATIACKRIAPGVCEESGDVALPPDGFGSQATDTVPAQSKTEDVDLDTVSKQNLAEFDGLWDSVAEAVPAYKKVGNVVVRRVLTCHIIARAAANLYALLTAKTVAERAVVRDDGYAALLAMCVQATVTGQQSAGPARDAATTGRCSTAVIQMPVLISRSGSRYTIRATGPMSRASGRTQLAVSCRRTTRGLAIRVTPRRRGQRLKSLIGSHFIIGYASPGKKPLRFRATFRFS